MFLLDDINGHLYYIIDYFLAYFSAVLNCPFFMLFKFAPLLICSLSSVYEIKYKIGRGGAIAKWGYYRTAGANHKHVKNL